MNYKNHTIIYSASYILMMLVNAIAVVLPFGGQSLSRINQNYYVLFSPAPYAFLIWGLIYLLLLGFVIFMIQPQNKADEIITKIGYLFPISCLLNSLWLVIWLYECIFISVFINIGLLITIAIIYSRLQNETLSIKSKLFIKLPFSVYTAWVFISTMVNISYYLNSVGFGGFGFSDTFWACIMIAAVTFLGIYLLYKYLDIAFMLVIVWTLLAIYSNRSDYSAITITISICTIALVIIAILVNLLGEKKIK